MPLNMVITVWSLLVELVTLLNNMVQNLWITWTSRFASRKNAERLTRTFSRLTSLRKAQVSLVKYRKHALHLIRQACRPTYAPWSINPQELLTRCKRVPTLMRLKNRVPVPLQQIIRMAMMKLYRLTNLKRRLTVMKLLISYLNQVLSLLDKKSPTAGISLKKCWKLLTMHRRIKLLKFR